MSFNGTPVYLALFLHVEITFNLPIVLLKVPLSTAFPSFPKRIDLFFFFFGLTQPWPPAQESGPLWLRPPCSDYQGITSYL